MDVTPAGISILVNPLQYLNAEFPMDVTPAGIFVFLQPCIRVFVSFSIMALQLSLLSYTVLPASTTMLVNPLQLLNTESPMDVTPAGISMLFNPLQPLNAYSPMDVTPAGIFMLVNLLQPLNAYSPMDVTPDWDLYAC